MRLLRLLIAGAVAGGAIVVLKRLLAENGGRAGSGSSDAESATAGPEGGSGRSGGASGSSPGSSGGGPAASANGGEPTKAELYERAQELGIEGRSRMSKQELKRAIESAR